MATTTKSKRRASGSKTKLKDLKAAGKRRLTPAKAAASARDTRGVLLKASLPTTSARRDPHPQYTKAINFLMSHTDYEKMRVVRYNTTTFSLDRMRSLLK